MSASATSVPTRKTVRTALAHDARRIADELEAFYVQLERVGAHAVIRQYMATHQEGVPRFDLLQAAKALRCYGGVLALIASATPRSTEALCSTTS